MITIRPAEPADASAFADLADMASGQLYSAVLGSRTRPVLENMFRQPANDNSYQHVYFVTVSGHIAGMICGYSAAQTTANPTNRLYARHLAWHILPVLLRGWRLLPLLNFVDHLPAEQFYVLFVAIYPAFRGQGLSMRLLQHADEIAHQHSCHTLALDVEIHNLPAINAYHKHGMKQASVSPTVKFRGQDVGLFRMEKSLI